MNLNTLYLRMLCSFQVLGPAALVVLLAIPARAQHGPPRVVVAPVEKRVVATTLTLVGTVQPTTRSTIAAEVAGLVVDYPVEEGDRVEKGQIITRLEDTPRRLLYEEAEAVLKQLEAQLAELKAGSRNEEIARAKAAMDEAHTLFGKWETELKRIESLREDRSATLKEYNDVVAETAAARLRYEQAKAVYDMAVEGPRKEEILAAEMAVEARRAVVGRLKWDLDRSAIRAPFTGFVTREYTQIGQWLPVGGSVIELIDLDRVYVRVDVPESAIGAAKAGEKVGIIADAVQGMFQGTIRNVIPQADEKARTFPIEIELDNPEYLLKSGMFARARVPAGPTEEQIVVPRDAIVQRGTSFSVVMVGPSSFGPEGSEMATPVSVQLGADLGSWIAVNSPALQPGMKVAVKGHDRIYGPSPVVAVPADLPATRPAGEPTTRPVAALEQE